MPESPTCGRHRPTGAVVAMLALLAIGSCHDASRSNPMDPVLTPAVTLMATLDDTAGTVTLTWTQCAGEQPFAEYRVLRNVQRSTVVDTVATIAAVADTSYVDSTGAPGTAYEYRLEVVNRAGLPMASAVRSVVGYTVSGASVLAVESDSLAGAIRLRWTRFVGPGFAGYQVIRRVAEMTNEEKLGPLSASTDTVFADTTAQAGVPYVYRHRITVVTHTGEEVSGPASSGRFHAYLVEWPLPISAVGRVRLYHEDGGLTALVAEPDRIRLLLYTFGGELRDERVLVDLGIPALAPNAVSMARLPDGGRWLSLAVGDTALVAVFSPQGDGVWQQLEPFADASAVTATAISADVVPPSGIRVATRMAQAVNQSYYVNAYRNRYALLDNIQAAGAGGPLFVEDFSSDDLRSRWTSAKYLAVEQGRAVAVGTQDGTNPRGRGSRASRANAHAVERGAPGRARTALVAGGLRAGVEPRRGVADQCHRC